MSEKKSKYRLVAIIGESASGKDTILNSLCCAYPSLNKKVSTTTRPKRDYEEEGKDYFFVDDQEFADKLLNYEMVEASDFRDWFYGTELKTLDIEKINVGAFNVDGVRALIDDPRIELLVFSISAPDKLRLIRSLSRESDPDINEIIRRFYSDQTDFGLIDFPFYPLVNDGNRTIMEVVENMKEAILKYFGQKRFVK